MQLRTRFNLLSTVIALVIVGCADSGTGRVLDLNATGGLKGVAYIDRNGNGVLETNVDTPIQGVIVKVTPFGTLTRETRATSNVVGSFLVQGLNVGEYAVTVESTSVPDSLRVTRIDSAKVRVAAVDTPTVVVALSFPTVTARAARLQPTGKRVFIEGVTINSWTTFGDSTLHVADSSGVLRVTRVAAINVASGMRVRVLGTTELRDGQRTLTDATVFPIASAAVPAPTVVTSAVAAKADAGKLDAALVQIIAATILGGQTNAGGDFVLTVNDGSGSLEVVLDRNTGIPLTSFIPGATLSVIGVLVPSDKPGDWQLKPRAISDLNATFPIVNIGAARKLELGKIVQIDAVALNGWLTYGDSTVHIYDPTGSMRAIRVQQVPSLFAGSKIRLIGTIGFANGQPVLANTTATVLGTDVLPLPEVLTTVKAATADAGKWDAARVKVVNVTVADTATVSGDFRIRVDDGSGILEVLLDNNSNFFPLSDFLPGTKLDITGLLVPITGGVNWRLKPTQRSDLVVR